MTEVEIRFHDQMIETVYRETGRQCGYWAHRFLQMVRTRGGLETARTLLDRSAASRGFDVQRERGRLDLSLEALVLRPEFRELFSAEQRARAEERLRTAGFVNVGVADS